MKKPQFENILGVGSWVDDFKFLTVALKHSKLVFFLRLIVIRHCYFLFCLRIEEHSEIVFCLRTWL